MRKSIKVILIIVGIFVGIILLDMIQARIFRRSPFISWKVELEDNDSWIDKGILLDTYYCVREKDIVTVSWHFKGSNFTCTIDNEDLEYSNYKKVSSLKSNNIDTNVLIMFDGILYGRSYAMLDYLGGSKPIGIIDKLIPNEYIPKLNGETNIEEILNASVYDKTYNKIVLFYDNEYVLFYKINNDNNKNIIKYVIMEDENGDNYKIYYYGIDSAMITVDKDNYDFEQAILTGTLTLDEILAEMKLYAELNDGGTKIYKDNGSRKYFSDSYSIIKCNTVDGNRDIYIGDKDMLMEEGFCKFKTTDAEIKLQEQIEKIRSTKKIIVKNKYNHKILNTITKESDIKNIIDILSHSIESTLPTTSEGTNLLIQMYDTNDKLLTSIYVWKSGYFGFNYGKEYFILKKDLDIFNNIINN